MRWKPSPSAFTALAGLLAGLAVVALLPGPTLFTPHSVHNAAAAGGVPGERWACPMMDYIGHQPGDCPVCGMKLQKVTAGELNREQQRRMGVELSTVTEGTAAVTVHAYGAAEYDHRFSHVVIPRLDGRIVKRHSATFGAHHEIEAGTPIVDLYSPDLISAQGELAAAVKLGQPDLVAALSARFARWNLPDLAESIRQGGAIQDTVTIRSAFAGQVLLRDMDVVNDGLEVGREVKADTPLLRLVDPDRLVLVVHVPETRARFLTAGQSVAIASDDLGPLPAVQAVIGRLAPEINPEIRTREVRIYLTGARNVLQPGSLVAARLHATLAADLGPADPLVASSWARFPLVPKTAVLSTGVRHVAWRVAGRQTDGRLRFELAPLALGPRIEDENGNDVYVVRAGLKPGDEVATQGVFLIDSQAQLAGTASLLFPAGAVAAPAHQH